MLQGKIVTYFVHEINVSDVRLFTLKIAGRSEREQLLCFAIKDWGCVLLTGYTEHPWDLGEELFVRVGRAVAAQFFVRAQVIIFQ